MKIYKNPWVSRESYFVKTNSDRSITRGYSIDFWQGKWNVRKTSYYNSSLSEMPVIFEDNRSFQTLLDKAIVNIILHNVNSQRKEV